MCCFFNSTGTWQGRVGGGSQGLSAIDTTLWEITRKHFDWGAKSWSCTCNRVWQIYSCRYSKSNLHSKIPLGTPLGAVHVAWGKGGMCRECAAMYLLYPTVSCPSDCPCMCVCVCVCDASETLFKIKPKRFKWIMLKLFACTAHALTLSGRGIRPQSCSSSNINMCIKKYATLSIYSIGWHTTHIHVCPRRRQSWSRSRCRSRALEKHKFVYLFIQHAGAVALAGHKYCISQIHVCVCVYSSLGVCVCVCAWAATWFASFPLVRAACRDLCAHVYCRVY